MRCFLCGPFRIKYSIRSERKVDDQFFQELLVIVNVQRRLKVEIRDVPSILNQSAETPGQDIKTNTQSPQI
jgi:hypothetical protein